MERAIVSFERDEAGDWIAHLDCGHRRHVRHEPPRVERPWVLEEAGRAAAVGRGLPCGHCAERRWPDSVSPYRRTPEFDETSLPAALRQRHTTKRGVWARIHVLEGRLAYRIFEPFDVEEVLEPGREGTVLPEVPHAVEPLGRVRLYVAFHRRGG